MKPKPPRWVWCDECEAWIDATPPMLPPFWSLDKSARMHENGSKHKVTRVPFADLIWPQREGAQA